jgi:RimJ/RimL family protein N-acetyltransferase
MSSATLIEVLQELNEIVRNTECFRAAEKTGKFNRVSTGDGMALVFLHSPEEPVRCALEISRALRDHPRIQLRMGVHSGPVNQVRDVNDKTNIVGSGINVAQRVMDCGDAGHILLSRHVVDDLSEYRHWHPYLHDLGECEVKHGLRLHEPRKAIEQVIPMKQARPVWTLVCEAEIVRLAAAMDEQSDKEIAGKKQRDQMLKLVAKGFYNELTNYGVRKHEIIQVASHLLDNLLAKGKSPTEGVKYYNGIFTLASVKDEWAGRKQLAIQHVTLRPLQQPDVSKVIVWLKVPAVRESFVPRFPENQSELRKYFTHPTREYFGVYYNDRLVGVVGGENIDLAAGKLEMKKLVGESGLQGKGIGKRATFGFLYYAFMIRNLNKVYIHSRDINMRNINLNSRFGFELEGVFLDDITVGDKYQDVLRMALFKPLWLQIFSRSALAANHL